MVVEGRSKRLGLAQQCQDTLRAARRMECRAQGKPEIDGLLVRVTGLRQMRESTECLLEISYSFVIGRPFQGPLPRLPAVVEGLVPDLALREMMCQLGVVLFQPVRIEFLDGFPNGLVQGLASLQ